LKLTFFLNEILSLQSIYSNFPKELRKYICCLYIDEFYNKETTVFINSHPKTYVIIIREENKIEKLVRLIRGIEAGNRSFYLVCGKQLDWDTTIKDNKMHQRDTHVYYRAFGD